MQHELTPDVFAPYPITTLVEVGKNSVTKSAQRFYLGKAKDMKSFSLWAPLFKELSVALNHPDIYYDPSIPSTPVYSDDIVRTNISITTFLPAANILGVQYNDGTFHFVQLWPASNDLHEAVGLLKSYHEKNIPIDGEYEKLKDAPEQFTPQRLIKMWIFIFVVIAAFAVLAVSVAVIIDSR